MSQEAAAVKQSQIARTILHLVGAGLLMIYLLFLTTSLARTVAATRSLIEIGAAIGAGTLALTIALVGRAHRR